MHIAIAGGGIAGLTAANLLARQGHRVTVLEKGTYPQHRVCGEYLSAEVGPLLEALGILPNLMYKSISHLSVSAASGRTFSSPLSLGAYGISRYRLDHALCQSAQAAGASVITGAKVKNVQQGPQGAVIVFNNGQTIEADLTIACHGKRSALDAALQRPFLKRRSPWVGVKWHMRLPGFAEDRIFLHNFRNGYLGISPIEDGQLCVCYLVHRDEVRRAGSIGAMEEKLLCANPLANEFFQQAERLWQRALVINEIAFGAKETTSRGMPLVGDSAGMIAPLCGNGMAMAMRSALMLSECLAENHTAWLRSYSRKWQAAFSARLAVGKQVQNAFGGGWATEALIGTAKAAPPLARQLIRATHGRPVYPGPLFQGQGAE